MRRPRHISREARTWAYARDLARCVQCGFDARALPWELTAAAPDPWNGTGWASHLPEPATARLIAAGFSPRAPLWEADHAVPYSHNPAIHAPSNIRTLCHPCHALTTTCMARPAPSAATCPACTDHPAHWSPHGVCVHCAAAVLA
jgi:hypothetical protein